jgi:hypothetical protein
MGIFNKLFGGGEVISQGMNYIDEIHTSGTEMIEAKIKAKTDLLASYAPFKVAQRYLSLIFGFTFVVSYILILVLFLLGKNIVEVQQIISVFKIDWIMLTIVGFYFGGGAFEGVLGKMK